MIVLFFGIGSQGQSSGGGGGWLGSLIGIGGDAIQNLYNKGMQKRQFKQEKQLMQQQFMNQKNLNTQGHDLSFRMWEKTNYPAQMKMLRKAGLNPALMYGQAGAGGTTSQSGGGSAASGSAPGFVPMEIGLSLAKAAAELDLLKSQKKKTDAEADNTVERTKTESGGNLRGASEIDNMKADVKSKEAKTQLDNVSAKYTQILGDISKAKTEQDILESSYRVDKLTNEIEFIGYQNDVERQVIHDRVKGIRAEAVGKVLENKLTKVNTSLAATKITEIANHIVEMQAGIQQKDDMLSREAFEAELKARYPGILNVGGAVLGDIFENVMAIFHGKKYLRPKQRRN